MMPCNYYVIRIKHGKTKAPELIFMIDKGIGYSRQKRGKNRAAELKIIKTPWSRPRGQEQQSGKRHGK